MTNNKVQIKVKQRCNKIDSNDYDNLESWVIQEAMNKAQTEFCRRQLHGGNQYREGAEQSIRRIDDLQQLLTPYKLTGESTSIYFESTNLPKDYFEFNKVIIQGTKDKCTVDGFKVFLTEEANTELLLSDENYKPSFDWRETFCTLINNKVRIYTNGEFILKEPKLIYYRQPKEIKFLGTINLDTGENNTIEQECEFKTDIVELIVDEAAAIITGDLESIQTQRLSAQAERNN